MKALAVILAAFLAMNGRGQPNLPEVSFNPFQAVKGAGFLQSGGSNPVGCISSKAFWLTNFTAALSTNSSMSVTFTIAGGSNNGLYDVFMTQGFSNPASNTSWTWMGQSYHCVTNTITNLANIATYFTVGNSQDSDNDGLTDAYEMLVSHTDPDNANTDGSGWLDGWLVLYGCNPLDPSSIPRLRLGYWSFDDTNRLGNLGQTPMAQTNLQLATGWITNAVQVDSNAPARLAYRVMETNGWLMTTSGNPNINLTNGSIRFRFRPDWNYGSGPNEGHLIDAGDKSSRNGWWGLIVTNFGENIVFAGRSNEMATNYLTADLGAPNFTWVAGAWYEFTLAYTPSNSSLYIFDTNGYASTAFGTGVIYYPTAFESALTGFNVGADLNGSNQCAGTIDELETFNYPLDYLSGPLGGGYYATQTDQVLLPAANRVMANKLQDLVVSPDRQTVFIKSAKFAGALSTTNWTALESHVNFSDYVASSHGIAVNPGGTEMYATDSLGILHVYLVTTNSGVVSLTETNSINMPDGSDPFGIAISADGATAYVCLSVSNALAVVDLASGTVTAQIPVGIYPYGVALSQDGTMAYVSDCGGRAFKRGELRAIGNGVPVLVNTNGLPTNGVVSFVDLIGQSTLTNVAVGLHPSDLVLNTNNNLLYVADENSDGVTVIDVTTTNVITNIAVSPYANCPYAGSFPDGIALSPDGGTLFVASAGNNAIAVVNTTNNQVAGLIPTDLFPGAIATDGTNLYVANVWGLPMPWADAEITLGGTVEEIPIPSLSALASNTAQVLLNGRIPQMQSTTNAAQTGIIPAPVPRNTGEPSVFQHVFYIIKENKQYDGFFGALPQGNGLASLAAPAEWIPNQLALATQFVLLDNYYCNGVQTDDGHTWSTQGTASPQVQKAMYSDPVHDGNFGSGAGDVTAYASSGFIWDNVAAHGLGYTNYGELCVSCAYCTDGLNWSEIYTNYLNNYYPAGFMAGTSNTVVAFPLDYPANLTNLINHTCPHFPGWYVGPLLIPDVLRADAFIYDLTNAAQTTQSWPAFTIMHLPNDHTASVTTGAPTPAAAIADNDLSVGKIVEAISHSLFWSNSVIFIIEDDPLSTGDHVDGHRSICMVASPYTKRRQTISSFYNQPGVLHTIEQMLGLPPMSQMDAISPLMNDCFTPIPDFTPFVCLSNQVNLNMMNTTSLHMSLKDRYWVQRSMKLDFSKPDKADPL